MRTFSLQFNLVFVYLFLVSCDNRELTRDRALEVIKQHESGAWLRDTLTYNVIVDSPLLANDFKKLSLEQEGFWRINPNSKEGSTVIFSEKAKPYLIGGVEKRSIGIRFRQQIVSYQQVITAQIEPDEISGVKLESGDRKAVVDLKMKVILTPFAQLNKRAEELSRKFKTLKISMTLYDDGWRVEKPSF